MHTPRIPQPRTSKTLGGFTLIELLIVVAIIAILAAIAVPNFLEAQTRAKVGRVKSDMRTVANALEAYSVDWNMYPFDGANWDGSTGGPYNYWQIPKDLSTPIAYISSISFPDPFRSQRSSFSQDPNLRYMYIDSTYGPKFAELKTTDLSSFNERYRSNFGAWRLSSGGPDGELGPPSYRADPPPGWSEAGWPGVNGLNLIVPYDPSNGTVSWGDIIRSQMNPQGGANFGT